MYTSKDKVSSLPHLITIVEKEPEETEKLLVTKENLLEHEQNGVLGSFFFGEHEELTSGIRTRIVDWLILVSKQLSNRTDTIFLAINILDSYLSRKTFPKNEQNVKVLSSLFLASRYLDVLYGHLGDFIFMSGDTITENQIIENSKDIFNVLGCNLNIPNEMYFIRYSSQASLASAEEHNLVKNLCLTSLLGDIKEFSVLPSLKVSSIRYLSCKVLGDEFVNVFEIEPKSIIRYAQELIYLFRRIKASSVILSWKKLVKGKPDKEKWLSDFNKVCNLQVFTYETIHSYYLRKTYFKKDISISLFPRADIPKGLKRLGEGGFGVVKKFSYQGESFAIKKDIRAIKDDVLTIAFLREVSIMRSLDHKYIMKIKHITDDFSYIFSDLGSGDLRSYIDSRDIDEDVQLTIASQLLGALSYMHDKGCIHRDIKPQNIIVFEYSSGNLEFRIGDFGSCRGTDIPIRNNSFTSGVCTLWYRSPELFLESNAYGDGVDVWSMMCLLYECATKEVLFEGDSANTDQLLKFFMVLGTPDESSWPGVELLPNYNPDLPKFQPQIDYFDKNTSLSNCYKELLNTGLVLNPDNRPRASVLDEIVDEYIGGDKQ